MGDGGTSRLLRSYVDITPTAAAWWVQAACLSHFKVDSWLVAEVC